MELNSYAGISKPDEKKTLPLKDNLSFITNLFAVWNSFIEKNIDSLIKQFVVAEDEQLLEKLADEMQHLVEHKKLPSVIDGKEYFAPISAMKKEHRDYAGLFYTALLNNGVKRIVVPKEVPIVHHWGYKLECGILEFYAQSGELGKDASGGCIINKGHIGIMGRYATGGVFLHKGNQEYVFPARSMGKGVFVDCVRQRVHLPEYGFEVWLDEEPNKKLSALLTQLDTESRCRGIQSIAKNIESYCIKYYRLG